MEAPVEDLTPLGVLKQPKVFGAWFEVGRYFCVGEVHLNLAGARDIERRAIPKRDMPAVPPPAWKLGFDQPSRSVNRARHIRGSQAKCTLELAVEFRRATGNGLDFLQKFPQIHFRNPLWPNRSELCSTLLTVVLMTARWRSKASYRSARTLPTVPAALLIGSNGRSAAFTHPHRDLPKEEVVRVRKFLETCGITPAKFPL